MPAPTAKRPTRFHPFAGRDLPWLLDRQATARPDKPFIISEPADGVSQTFTYADFALETRRFAAGLAARGVAKGEAVVIHLDNCPEFLIELPPRRLPRGPRRARSPEPLYSIPGRRTSA